MNGNHEKILLDLNYPEFQSALFELDISELKKIVKTLRKLQGMTWDELFRDHGFKWEQIKSLSGKYTIRLSLSYRAVVLRHGAWMRFQTLHTDHDGAYRKQ